ncbi:MAG: hypothetical protein PHQ34_09980 [Methanothrix sp.]|nr:hypothetical protein [Methanothrix sp.]
MVRKNYKIEAFVALFIGLMILFAVAAAAGTDPQTKTAYTRDGIHFISKERVDENIRYEYAKQGEYREVQVPLDTVVVGGSSIPQNITTPKEKETPAPEENLASSQSTDRADLPASEGRYPYAPLFIGLLATGGLLIFVASVYSGRNR